jgi:hypothetical protein
MTFSNLEIFLIVISTPFILAAIFVMLRKYIKIMRQDNNFREH